MDVLKKRTLWLSPCRTSKYWKKLRSLITTLYKSKRTLSLLIEILHKAKTHITFHLDTLAMDKNEYFDINDLIRTLQDKIIAIRKTLLAQGILSFDTTNLKQMLEALAEIYVQTLYITEKYGLVDIPTTLNIYMLAYTNLFDLYSISHQPVLHSPTSRQPSPDKFVSPYDTSTEDEDERESLYDINDVSPFAATSASTESPTLHSYENQTVQSVLILVAGKMLGWLRQEGHPHVLGRFLSGRISSHAGGSEYLDIANVTCRPFQINAFIQSPEGVSPGIFDMYQLLNIFSSIGLVNNSRILATNSRISNIYRDLLTSKFANGTITMDSPNIVITDINNKAILNTLPEMNDNTQGRVVHVLIRVPVSRQSALMFVLNCYIMNDDCVITQKYPLISRKMSIIKQQINSLTDITAAFKTNIVNIITLKQCLCVCVPDIIQWCYAKWELYQETMARTLINCMNHFLTQSKSAKANILTVLLINHSVPDSAYRAFILWDLLIDESINITGNAGLEHGIFQLIQPELQNHLKHILDINYERTRQITTINENDLEYERKIMLSQADDATKARAFEKLREVSNKASDNSSKAQKYLDGLLAIPFGKYSKEWIITKNDNLYTTVRVFFGNLLAMCLEYQDTYAVCGELYGWLLGELGLSSVASQKLDDERLDTLVNNHLANNKCGVYQIKRLETHLTNLLSNLVLVSNDHLVYEFIHPILESLDINSLSQLFIEIRSSHPNIHWSSLTNKPAQLLSSLDTAVKDPIEGQHVKSTIINWLIEENHFYDIGYPSALITYKTRLAELLEAWDTLKLEKQRFLTDSYARLDASIYGQTDAKDQLIRIIAQWINGNQSGYCLGFEGSPGLGKTSLAKYGISQALADKDGKSRPFGFIALGGSSNGSILEGHSYTYVGSTWGRIADILMQSKCMNPIIFVDELDKISTTENGKELIGILTHLTDRTQNNEFMDKYFDGVRLDLSKVLFIFSYNDYELLDSILADRIHRIQFNNYTVDDKIVIARDYLIPKISDEINILGTRYIVTPEIIRYLVDAYTYEAGVRKLKEKLYDIFRELNVRDIRSIGNKHEETTLTSDMVDDIISSYYKIDHELPYPEPRVGIVYGMFATSMGVGGVLIIQVARKRVDLGTNLKYTGQQGEVMTESMEISLTLACNLVPRRYLVEYGIRDPLDAPETKCADCSKKATKQVTDKYAFHIHCPDGSTPKDGPSAGCAFTLALVSQLTNIPVRNDIAMTGEVDIMGNVLPIGGLDSKIMGSKRAGIRHVLVPLKNKKDIDRYRVKNPNILEGVEITYVSTIDKVVELCLTKPVPVESTV